MSPTRRSSSYDANKNDEPADAGIIGRVPFSNSPQQRSNEPNSFADNSLQPLLTKLSRRESQRSRLMSRSSSFLVAATNQLDPGLIDLKNPSQNDSDPSSHRKSLLLNTPKLLTKSKISYRDVMEG